MMTRHRWKVFFFELMEGRVFEDVEQARSGILSYLEGYDKQVRLGSRSDYRSPIEFEVEFKR